MLEMATKSAVHREILRLKHNLHEQLKLRTADAGIGLTNVSMSAEQQLAQKMLFDGRPKAFVEFFGITTTLEPEPTNKEDEEAGIRFPIAEAQRTLRKKEVLTVLSKHLVAAESAARHGNNEQLCTALTGVGDLFDRTCYFATSVSYYSRALDAALNILSTRNTVYVTKSKYSLGKIYWKMHKSLDAISCHEEALELARFINDGQQVVLSAKELLQIYWACALDSDSDKETISYFEKCVSMGVASHDLAMAAEAKYNIGLLYKKLNQIKTAVKYQTEYLEFVRGAKDRAGECKAHAALSEAFEADGNATQAVFHMRGYLGVAGALDPATKAMGHCLLGSLYHRREQRDEALDQFGKYFAIARQLESPDLLDVARVNTGIAREYNKARRTTMLGQCPYWMLA